MFSNSVNKKEKNAQRDYLDLFLRSLKGIISPVLEIHTGFRLKTIPVERCMLVGILAYIFIFFGADLWFLNKIGIGSLYPETDFWHHVYNYFWLFFGFILWGFIQVNLRSRLIDKLTDVFISAGLKTGLGKLPSFISDREIDDHSRKLTLLKNYNSFEDFKKAKNRIEGSLQIYIDNMKENREEGTIDIMYSHSPMPNLIKMENIDRQKPNTFVIGHTRSNKVTTNLKKVPHYLVAGQTNFGKSTLLRQIITSLYLNNKNMTFCLVDLKEGLEFQTFKDIRRIKTYDNLQQTVQAFEQMTTQLHDRMQLIKKAKCKDIDQLLSKEPEELKKLEIDLTNKKFDRKIIVVDEVAEIFLVKGNSSSQKIQEAKRAISKIARQGRAAGMHLILATQRPDTKTIDSQVKANLPGVVCFPMANDASSITALGTGRATDLPAVPGRAIWKCGYDFVEVQTPYLDPEEAAKLFEPYRTTKSDSLKNEPKNISSNKGNDQKIPDDDVTGLK